MLRRWRTRRPPRALRSTPTRFWQTYGQVEPSNNALNDMIWNQGEFGPRRTEAFVRVKIAVCLKKTLTASACRTPAHPAVLTAQRSSNTRCSTLQPSCPCAPRAARNAPQTQIAVGDLSLALRRARQPHTRAKKAAASKGSKSGTRAASCSISGGVAQWQSVRFACGKPRVQTPAPPPSKQLRGAMDSVSDFESGGCGFESRRGCFVEDARRLGTEFPNSRVPPSQAKGKGPSRN